VRAEQAGSGQPEGGFGLAGPVWRGAVPGSTGAVVTEAVRVIEGTGRSSWTPTQTTAAITMTAPAISARERSFRLPAAARRGSAWRPARRGSIVPPLVARGRNSLRRMTHHRNKTNGHPVGGSAKPDGSRNSLTAGSGHVTGIAKRRGQPAHRPGPRARLRTTHAQVPLNRALAGQ
jgi:hypothetical protein